LQEYPAGNLLWSEKMAQPEKRTARKVLIASANPLFGKGLENMLRQRGSGVLPDIRMAGSMVETLEIMQSWTPDLVVVDYDDRTIDRGEFLSHFVATDQPMQVMLVSLQASGAVVVYDRKTLTPAQAEDWLNLNPETPPAKKSPPKTERSSGPMRHFVIVGMLVAITSTLVYLFLTNAGLLPVEAAQQAVIVDQLFNLHWALISFLFSLIVVALVYSIVVFRGKPGDTGFGKFFKGNSRLEVFWTVIPLMTVITVAYIGSQNLAAISTADPKAMIVKVTAFQWNWQFEYPDYGITTDTLYLPVNKQVLLQMTSRDVIHSFWVPEFRVKQDVLPGANLVKELRITPDLIGNYKVRCAELCGGAHAAMVRPVIVQSQQDFDAWVAQETAANTQDPATRGQKTAEIQCHACHSVDGSKGIGPTWKGVFGSQVELENGTTVTADEAYLRESIENPSAKIVKGFPNIMPSTYKTTLTEQQISDLIAYIETLK
jgi:cytochrome c oxidase subunit 2